VSRATVRQQPALPRLQLEVAKTVDGGQGKAGVVREDAIATNLPLRRGSRNNFQNV
jgi:hypothetical protein